MYFQVLLDIRYIDVNPHLYFMAAAGGSFRDNSPERTGRGLLRLKLTTTMELVLRDADHPSRMLLRRVAMRAMARSTQLGRVRRTCIRASAPIVRNRIQPGTMFSWFHEQFQVTNFVDAVCWMSRSCLTMPARSSMQPRENWRRYFQQNDDQH